LRGAISFGGVTKRLFIGLEIPANCQAELAALDPRIRGVRWLPAGQMHLTMSFLGDVPPLAEERLRDALTEVRVPPFFLPIAGVGTFGGPRPSVVWAGVGRGHPHLFALHKHTQDAVLRAGLEADLRPFHPHITIGRAKEVSRAALKPFLQRYAETEFDFVQITGFTLFSSVLTPDGAIHTVEMRQEF
jgi:2'-5' RNA ligase